MENKKYRPLFDKLYWCISVPTTLFVLITTVVLGILSPETLFWMIPLSLFITYFFISPFFGYVELRETSLFIKYGFFLKKEISYHKIRDVQKEKRFYSESMISLKNAFEHVNIKYNAFDVTSISIVESEAFLQELEKRIA
jgi:uncharacterized membrane protein YdbT with pleckstrin-like domain